MKDNSSIKGKTVVITGASSGAGKAIALELAQYGTNLILSSRNEEALQDVVSECVALGSVAIAVTVDVTDPKDLIKLADQARQFGNRIDVWVNNAGVLAVGEFGKTPTEVHEQVIKINLLGYIYGAHAVLPYFKEQGSGILINNISVGGFLPVPFGVSYSASKFGLKGFSAALKAELSSFPDIHVCDMFPAFLDTPGIQHAANYTGKVLRPAPPVYDPNRLALAVASLIEHPRPEIHMGSASTMLWLAYKLFPSLTRGATKRFIDFYLKNADPASSTNGNLFNTVNYGTGIHGGWGLPGKPKAHRKYIAAGLVLATAGILLKGLSKP
ncbi:SDR family oxidoreductase [Desertivirga brevis]|uniref:SDR family oxidoreductase n=1 Tax=Desertivirga brevis TaxID=2810310 RepID=UPI001A96E2DB|nr:SDR family oxidoreductase [Pedobacter sp. SYSU D00873]